MKNEKLINLKELIDDFDSKYYDKENEKLRREIENIRMGKPRHEGIQDKYRKDIVPESQIEKEISKIKKEIRDNIEKAKELEQTLSQLRVSVNKLETLAQQDILLSSLKSVLLYRSGSKTEKTNIYEENINSYYRLYNKSERKIYQSKNKISKELYKLIKKKLLYMAYKSRYSIATALKENKIQIIDKYSTGNIMFSDVRDEYKGFPYSENIKKLGVDIEKIKYAREKIIGDLERTSLTWHGKPAFDKLQSIEKLEKTPIDIKGGYSKLIEIKKDYIEIVELSRETWYLKEILEAFRNTDVKKTETYQGLKELAKSQEAELYERTREIDKLYEKIGLQNKIEMFEKLEELYTIIEELEFKIEQFEKNGDYSQASLIREEYYDVKYKMIKILKDNPDLNKTKYNIDIEKIIKREKELFDLEIKQEVKKEKNPSTLNSELENLNDSITSEMPEKEQTIVEEKNDINEASTYIQTEEEKSIENTYTEEINKTQNFELDSNLQIFRTAHYQNYMKEKVLNSNLGKISFSAYLETVAPYLTDLIKIEKEREQLARTIYKDYIKYYGMLENKNAAMSFDEFANSNYSVSNIDVPIEYEEEYKGFGR